MYTKLEWTFFKLKIPALTDHQTALKIDMRETKKNQKTVAWYVFPDLLGETDWVPVY